MTKEEEIKSIPPSKIRLYSSPDAEFQLEKDYGDEIERKESYHGREILELLQNVDDAYQSLIEDGKGKKGDKVTAFISLDHDILTVANTGTAFSFESIKRLCVGHASKKGDKYIGNKGTGFRSVLNWAKEVEIYSDGYNFKYSESFSKKCFDLIDRESIKSQISNKPNLSLPVLSVPEWIDDERDNRTEEEKYYSTVIKVFIDPNTQNDKQGVKDQLEDLDMNILLFLPNISDIEIKYNNQTKLYSKKTISYEYFDEMRITSVIKENEERISELRYAVKSDESKTIYDKESKKDKSINLAVAIPLNDDNQKDYCLYNYFPLRNMKSPFGVLLHATFVSLDQHRDSINADTNGYNKKIFEFLLELFVNFVSFYYREANNYEALKKFAPNNYKLGSDYFKNTSLEQFGLEKYFYDLIRKSNILITVNNKNISIEDIPFTSPEGFPSELKGDGFEKILKPFIADENKEYQNDFFKSLKIPRIDSNFLCTEIEKRKDKLSIKQRVFIFCWWITEFNNSDINFIPCLLNDINGNPISYGKRCFYQSDNQLDGSELDFADFVYLDDSYAEELIIYFETYKKREVQEKKSTYKNPGLTTTKRVIPYFLKPFIDLREFTTKNIISTINSCIGESDYANSIAFVNWLWEVFDTIKKVDSDEENQNLVSDKISYHFPTVNKMVLASKEIYLGREYKNLLEELFINSNYQKLAPLSEFAFKDELLEDIVDFFKYFEVLECPKVEKEKEPKYLLREYRDFLWTKCKNITDWSCPKIRVSIIDNLEYLLSKDSKIILKWILSDPKIKNAVVSKYENGGKVEYREYNRKVDSELHPISSYLNYVFSNTKWVEIENHGKVSPNECLLISNDSLLAELHPCITNSFLSLLAEEVECKTTDLEELFLAFGAKTRISDLNSNEFYDLLLKIPDDKRENKKLASKIISQCIERSEGFAESENKNKFFNKGLVLAKQKGLEKFISVNEVRFSSSAVVNVKNYPLIKTPPRTGNKEIIKNIFNVRAFQEKYSVDINSIVLHPDNNLIEKQIKDFIPFVYALRQQSNAKTTELNVYKNLEIKLVSSLSISMEDNPKFDISEPYTIIYNKNEDNLPTDKKWYVYLPSKDQLDSFEFSKKSLEGIFYIIQNQMNVSMVGELFRANTYEQRLRLVEDKIEEDAIQTAKAILFESANKRIRKYLETKGVLTEQIKDIINVLDFDHIQENDVPLLKKFLNSFDYGKQDFKEVYSIPSFIIKDYNESIFRIYWSKNSDFYYLTVYKDLESKSEDEKLKYFQKKAEKERIVRIEIEKHIKDLNFNPATVLDGYEKIDDINLLNTIDAIYEENFKKLNEKYKNEDGFASFVKEYESLLYFKDTDSFISDKFDEIQKKVKLDSSGSENLLNTGKTPNITNALVPSTHENKGSTHSGFTNNPALPTEYDSSKTLENAKTGGLAELCVMESLENNLIQDIMDYFGEEQFSINWLSTYAKKYRKIKKINDAAGYDFYLCNSNGKELFIEVKSTTGNECAFLMSINEYTVAKKQLQNNNYWVIFVSKVKEKEPNINVIKTSELFMKDKFKVSTDTFYMQYAGI